MLQFEGAATAGPPLWTEVVAWVAMSVAALGILTSTAALLLLIAVRRSTESGVA